MEALVLYRKDNVATAIVDIKENRKVSVRIGDEWRDVLVRQPIPFGHKFALSRILRGGEVIKYGECIGKATSDIEVGEHVHIHNVESIRGRGDI